MLQPPVDGGTRGSALKRVHIRRVCGRSGGSQLSAMLFASKGERKALFVQGGGAGGGGVRIRPKYRLSGHSNSPHPFFPLPTASLLPLQHSHLFFSFLPIFYIFFLKDKATGRENVGSLKMEGYEIAKKDECAWGQLQGVRRRTLRFRATHFFELSWPRFALECNLYCAKSNFLTIF